MLRGYFQQKYDLSEFMEASTDRENAKDFKIERQRLHWVRFFVTQALPFRLYNPLIKICSHFMAPIENARYHEHVHGQHHTLTQYPKKGSRFGLQIKPLSQNVAFCSQSVLLMKAQYEFPQMVLQDKPYFPVPKMPTVELFR